MFGLFKSKNETDILEKKYKKLMEEYYNLSKTDRAQSDLKFQEAEEIMNKIDELKKKAT